MTLNKSAFTPVSSSAKWSGLGLYSPSSSSLKTVMLEVLVGNIEGKVQNLISANGMENKNQRS